MNRTKNSYIESTLQYYSENADTFFDSTVRVDFSDAQNRFLHHLPARPFILDFGCGSGRDTLAFLRAGAAVEAWDGNPEMCLRASRLTGISVKQALFDELCAEETYDGIWACASILHLSSSDLTGAFKKIETALKPDGFFYASFKYGKENTVKDGRFFTNFTEDSLIAFSRSACSLQMEDLWISQDVREGRSGEKWINILMRKQSSKMY